MNSIEILVHSGAGMTQDKEKALERAFEDAREKALLAFYEQMYDRWFANVKARLCQPDPESEEE